MVDFYGFHVDKHSIHGWYGRDSFAKQNRKPVTVEWVENFCQTRRRENKGVENFRETNGKLDGILEAQKGWEF